MFLKELKNINLTFIENRNWLLFCESDDDDDDDDDDDGGGDGGDSDEDDDGGGGDGWFLKSEDLKGSVNPLYEPWVEILLCSNISHSN